MKLTFTRLIQIKTGQKTGLLLAITIGIVISIACGGYEEDWSEESSTIISSSHFIQNSLASFYSFPSSYLDGSETHNTRFNEIILKEWREYMGNKASEHELNELMFETSEDEVNKIFDSFQERKDLSKHKWLTQIDREKCFEFLKYLANAKHAEVYAKVGNQDWSYENNKNRFRSQPGFQKQLEILIKKAKSNFIKQRYLFQLVRYHYFNKTDASVVFYKYNSNFPQNTMYYRTLSYLAGSLRDQGKFALANYYYSLVFENCQPLKVIAHYGFKPQEETDWKGTLSLCKNNDERLTLWAMLGIIYQDPIRSIEEIYKINPKSEYINLLAIRYVQSVENMAKKPLLYCDNSREEYSEDGSYNYSKTSLELIYKLAQEGQTSKPFLINYLASYLTLINAEYAKTQQFIVKAKKYAGKSVLEQSMVRLHEFIWELSTMKKIGSNEEKFLLSELTWLKYTKHDSNFYWILPYKIALVKISDKYKEQNEHIKSECFATHSSFYTNNKNLVLMQNFLTKSNKNAYEQLLDSLYQYQLDILYEHQAIIKSLNGELNESLSLLFKSNKSIELRGNPFNNNIKDCHDCDHEAYKGNLYTNISLIEKMLVIEKQIRAGENVYTNSLLLGNAYYNITHYGNARLFSEGGLFALNSSGWYIDSPYKEILLNMTQAIKYYQIALSNAKTDEQKAKCHFMLAKCNRNEWYNLTRYIYDYEKTTDIVIDFIAWEGFKDLKKYSNTKYAKEVINECGYFRTYINSGK